MKKQFRKSFVMILTMKYQNVRASVNFSPLIIGPGIPPGLCNRPILFVSSCGSPCTCWLPFTTTSYFQKLKNATWSPIKSYKVSLHPGNWVCTLNSYDSHLWTSRECLLNIWNGGRFESIHQNWSNIEKLKSYISF